MVKVFQILDILTCLTLVSGQETVALTHFQ
nr:MAG TPA: hypothetical protein [Caudoviricetes sp.]